MTILLEVNSRIDDRVEDVGDEISEQDKRGDNEVQRDEGWIVSLEHGLVTETPQPRVSENRLNDDRASNEAGEQSSNSGNQWPYGIAERVLVEDCLLRQALGKGRSDVVLAHRFDHTCAYEA